MNELERSHVPHHVDYSSVEVIAVPGRYYSVAELLRRVVRNQPIPLMTQYPDTGKEYKKDGDKYGSDDQVLKDIDKAESNILEDAFPDLDEIGRYSKYAED